MSLQIEEKLSRDRTENEPETQPVGIGIVGAGYWGRNLVRNALQSPSTRLTAVCDADVSRASALVSSFNGVDAVDDVRDAARRSFGRGNRCCDAAVHASRGGDGLDRSG